MMIVVQVLTNQKVVGNPLVLHLFLLKKSKTKKQPRVDFADELEADVNDEADDATQAPNQLF